MKSGLLEFKRNFEETTELHFPVYGFMDQTRYSDNYGFVPFVQSPGLALIIIGDEKGTAASLLLRSLAFCFPILFLCITMLWVSSLAMWFVVSLKAIAICLNCLLKYCLFANSLNTFPFVPRSTEPSTRIRSTCPLK